MSDSDSFITEVSEAVRRDRLFATMRRYGWIAIAVVLVLVAGAAINEFRKAQAEARAQALGDATLAALERDGSADRAAALAGIDTDGAEAAAVVAMLRAAELVAADDPDAAGAVLDGLATDGEVAEIYRQLASLKRLMLQTDTIPIEDRRLGFEALAVPGAPFRAVALEQLALIEVEEGNTDVAIERLIALIDDADATSGLRNRAAQLIVALGGAEMLATGAPNDTQ